MTMDTKDSVKYLNFGINYLHDEIEANQGDMSTFPHLMVLSLGIKQAQHARAYVEKHHKWDNDCKEIIPHLQRGMAKAKIPLTDKRCLKHSTFDTF